MIDELLRILICFPFESDHKNHISNFYFYFGSDLVTKTNYPDQTQTHKHQYALIQNTFYLFQSSLISTNIKHTIYRSAWLYSIYSM